MLNLVNINVKVNKYVSMNKIYIEYKWILTKHTNNWMSSKIILWNCQLNGFEK